jgi:adenosine deaminase
MKVTLIFDPTKDVIDDYEEVFDQLIEYFEDLEEYEKCATLLNSKNLMNELQEV